MPNETEWAGDLYYGLDNVLHPFWRPGLNGHMVKPLEVEG